MSSTDTVHFRYSQAIWVAAVIAFISALPLASAGWYLTPILVVPLLIGVWAWRAGTDADRAGMKVRALFGQRLIPWHEVVQLGVDDRRRVIASLTGGRFVQLPAVPAADLHRLVAASGQHLLGTDDQEPSTAA
ncbi:PH domain-containing protein [Micromonospora sp. NBC_01699]|uniref:PH domain-containing protein n=1 Tax=Micromonospora sp. NBC_01699 TaxID=2975984 RepID=UPI002E2ED858|nr:PH domain-containing protein [Micromonospora sp. NBC_01699]